MIFKRKKQKLKKNEEVLVDSDAVDMKWSFWTPFLAKELKVTSDHYKITHSRTIAFSNCTFFPADPPPDISGNHVTTTVKAARWRSLFGTLTAYTLSTIRYHDELQIYEIDLAKKKLEVQKLEQKMVELGKQDSGIAQIINQIQDRCNSCETVMAHFQPTAIPVHTFIQLLTTVYDYFDEGKIQDYVLGICKAKNLTFIC